MSEDVISIANMKMAIEQQIHGSTASSLVTRSREACKTGVKGITKEDSILRQQKSMRTALNEITNPRAISLKPPTAA
jgi:hypothetical protein